ncbi:MAG: aspartyl protease [Scytonematopsis contorta HA4267-MV1]|jgi:predicted aspartyl protease|nr:aspartyl protease [Scytonematopsis contorta HA4267-MV1]
MAVGSFGDNGELFFEIQLIALNQEEFSVEALLDTGFTDGFLCINTQDLSALGWPLLTSQIEMRTAKGFSRFNIHEGKVIIDGTEVVIPVHVGNNVPDTLMGALWLDVMQLLVNKPKGVLTLEVVDDD